MAINKARYLEVLNSFSEEFTEEDANELSVVLRNKSMQKALAEILKVAKDRDTLSSCNLATQEGLAQATESKGIVLGLRMALEHLLNLCEDENND